MLSNSQVQQTLTLLSEIFPNATVKYIVDKVDEDFLDYFSICSKKIIELHLRILNKLKEIWQCEDVAIVVDDGDILITPYSCNENLQ